jgi:hypothetical protein
LQALIIALAISIKQKQALLVKELLINIIKARDILFNIPAIAFKSIPFLKIIAEDIYKLIL